MTPRILLPSDLNAEDDQGENWGLIGNVRGPTDVQVGDVVLAGALRFWSYVRIAAVDDDGQIHFVQLDEDDPIAR